MSQFHLMVRALSFAALAIALTVVSASTPPSRIVTVGGAATEIVYALGAGDQVVAVDRSSTYPEAATELPQIGYIRNISPEGILSMNPDLVVTTESLGPPPAKAMLKQLSIPIIWCPEPTSVQALEQSLDAVSAEIGNVERAEAIKASVRKAVSAAKSTSANWPARPTAVFFLNPPAAGGAGLVAGEGTRSAELIELAGGVNAATGFKNFQSMSLESLIETNPDVIFVGLSDGHGASPESVEAMKKLPGLAGVTAIRNGAVYGVAMDDLAFGPRLGEAVTRWHGFLATAAE